jgi:hypothetical protein
LKLRPLYLLKKAWQCLWDTNIRFPDTQFTYFHEYEKGKQFGVCKDGRQVVPHVVQPCVTVSKCREYYNVKLTLRAAAFEAWPCGQQCSVITLSAINRRSSAPTSQHRLLKTCKLTNPALRRIITEVSLFRRSQQQPYNQRAVAIMLNCFSVYGKRTKLKSIKRTRDRALAHACAGQDC